MCAVTIERVYLVIMMMMMMHDAGDISICDIQATDDEVAEIFRKHIS